MIFDNVTELIGETPLVRLNKLTAADSAEVVAKLESFNPGGSIKDRVALNMIEEAEKAGLLEPGDTIIEPTSGNTGIGLALVGRAKGYNVILAMPESMSQERRKILKAYGAEIILTAGEGGMSGSIDKAKQLAQENEDYFMPQQFENQANPDVHRKTTAQEILKETAGELDAFVAGVGTGGTITGTGAVLKEEACAEIIAVEPTDSAVISGGKSGSHKIQGIGAGFIPEVLAVDLIDKVVKIDDEEAQQTARDLASQEGILAGISAGAAVAAALKVADKLDKEQRVVVIVPDTGERYLSTSLFNPLDKLD
ncbi:MAG: cysteine synthase A [Halanaerobacter sp.]